MKINAAVQRMRYYTDKQGVTACKDIDARLNSVLQRKDEN